MENNQLATRTKTISSLLEKCKSEIAKVLPKHVTPDRIARIALTTIRQNPQLLMCDEMSLLAAIMKASQLGLDVDPILGHAYLIPYKSEATLIIGYRGYLQLARQSGEIDSTWAACVYERETFELDYGLECNLKHKPLSPSERGEKKIGVYAVAKLKTGEVMFDFLWAEEVQRIKAESIGKMHNPAASPWVKHEDEMFKKTAFRRLSKRLPLSVEIARTIESSEESGRMLLSDDNEIIDVFAKIKEEPKTQSDKAKKLLQEKSGTKDGGISDNVKTDQDKTVEPEIDPLETDWKSLSGDQRSQILKWMYPNEDRQKLVISKISTGDRKTLKEYVKEMIANDSPTVDEF